MGVLYARVAGAWVPVGGGGSGADEVHVGPDQPADTLELWVDTDETAPLPDDTRWNTAWGIVAMLQPRMSVAEPIATAVGGAYLTEVMPFTTIVGRRYRFVATVRAINRPSYSFFLTWTNGYDTGAGIPGFFAYWVHDTPANTWGGTVAEWIMDGDGVARNYAVLSQCPDGTAQLYHQSSDYYIEDMGPVSGAAPALMTTTDRWNISWGVVAVGSFVAGAPMKLNTGVVNQATNTLTYTMLTGRRYRVAFAARAAQSTSATGGRVSILLRDGSTVLSGTAIDQLPPSSAFNPLVYDWTFAGDGVSRAWNVALQNPVSGVVGDAWLDDGASFYIEDIGPVSGAVPIADPTPPWIPLAYNGAGWANYGGGWSPLSYRKVGDIVTVRGTTRFSPGGTNPAATLPVGYRPPYYMASAAADIQVTGKVLAVQTYINGSLMFTGHPPTGNTDYSYEYSYSVTP